MNATGIALPSAPTHDPPTVRLLDLIHAMRQDDAMPKPTKAPDAAPLSDHLVPALASLVLNIRPAWDEYVVTSVLRGHRTQADAADLVRAAVDAAADQTVHDPRAIGWSLRSSYAAPLPRCAECGQTADRCARRPGLDDDHQFVPRVT